MNEAKPLIIHNKNNPFKLDRIESPDGIPALTRHNADFIDAIVNLDSNYGHDLNKTCKPKNGFDPMMNPGRSQKENRGSTAYWFDQMNQNKWSYETCLLGAIITIDATNSTHLQAVNDARVVMKNRVMRKCPDRDSLIKALNEPFDASKEDHLLSLLTRPLSDDDPTHKDRANLSFASKFCSYAALFLNVEAEYSKYDRIVTRNLHRYLKAYGVNKKATIHAYDSDGKSWKEKLKAYQRFSEDIGKLIEASENQVNRVELDHIIWYYFKG